ncbi:hypothetical protein E2C01_000147 [Portunus trituberculatus]|uniref:Uncharacterized protein n=1 Tax=Portunus trituberculatus TaxID=210409 RepID=A0A5B7CIW5_PORTR|nr:hypothetical protein [Portunus trituberculatus]
MAREGWERKTCPAMMLSNDFRDNIVVVEAWVEERPQPTGPESESITGVRNPETGDGEHLLGLSDTRQYTWCKRLCV